MISVFTPSVVSRFNEFCAPPAEPHGCIEWTGSLTRGYGTLRVDGKQIYAHRIAWALWNTQEIPPPEMKVCHRCDNPPCVYGPHLFLGTDQDNLSDMVAKGRSTYGERNPQAKLTETQVREIRELRDSGVKGYIVADQFGLSQGAVSMIVNRQRWAHVS